VRRALARPGSEPELVCYAFADLDERLAFASTWLVLTSTELVVARTGRGQSCELTRIPRRSLSKVDFSTGLSCHALRAYGSPSRAGDSSGVTPPGENHFSFWSSKTKNALSVLPARRPPDLPISL
jgi:hypothetical protein